MRRTAVGLPPYPIAVCAAADLEGVDMTVTSFWPRVSRCRWCRRPVLRDNDDAWIHSNLAYVCRDRAGALGATTAEPETTGRGR